MSELILHPEIQALHDEIDLLRDELTGILTEAHNLVSVVKPNLLALYQTKIGAWELEHLRSKVRVLRLKRTLELAQASINHGAIPDWAAIEERLEGESRTWQNRIQEAAEALREAEQRTFLPPAEAHELKRLYYALVKKLHPDLNPSLTDEQKRLWRRVQDAYEERDLETLKALALSARNLTGLPPASSLETLQIEKDALNKHIAEALKRIKSIEDLPPFTMRRHLDDPAWVDARRGELEAQIAEYKKQEELFHKLLQPIMPPSHGQLFGSN